MGRATINRPWGGGLVIVLLCSVLLALPTAARAAPPVTDQEARAGFVDSPALNAMCRYAFLANLCGLPAATAPVGTSSQGLPVGLHIVGNYFSEARLLNVAHRLQQVTDWHTRAPAGFA